MQLRPETLLQGGKYRIIEKIGQGGFGIVYRAHHIGLQCDVCIKEFFFHDLCERASNSSQVTIISTAAEKIQLIDSLRKKFVKEAQRLAQFNDRGIIQVMDNFEENNTAYFVMEYLEGGSLEDLIEKDGALSEQKAKKMILPIIIALEAVHKKGLLHLDIKPANIMLRKDHSLVLIDFGISKYMDMAGGYTTTAPIGISKGYAPLEQYGGNISDFSPATDIYSLCATIYKMVTGITPPEPLQILGSGLKSPAELIPKLSCELSKLITQGLSIRSSDRPQNITTLKVILQDVDLNKTIVNTQIRSTTLKLETNNNILQLVDFKYDYCQNFIGGYASVLSSKSLKWGFIDSKGHEIISSKYDAIYGFSEGFARVKLNDRFGFISEKGIEIVPCNYYYAHDFENGIAAEWYKVDSSVPGFHYEKKRFINNKGIYITPTIDQLKKYSYSKSYFDGFKAIRNGNNEICFMPKDGPSPFETFLDAKNFSEGFAPVKKRGLLPGQWRGKWGYINLHGDLAIPLIYDEAYPFLDGLAIVEIKGKRGFINKHGALVIPCRYPSYFGAKEFSEGLAKVCSWTGDTYKYGYIDKNGNEVISMKYESANDFSEGIAAVKLKEKWGYIDKTGNIIIPSIYDDARECSEGIMAVKMKEKWGYIKLLK